MIEWINLTEEQKRTSISQAALKSGAVKLGVTLSVRNKKFIRTLEIK